MLVVQIKPGDKLKVGKDVEFYFKEKKNYSIKVGIDAPRNLDIKKIKKEESDKNES